MAICSTLRPLVTLHIMTSLWSIAALLLFCFSLSPPARVRAQSGTSACDCGYKDPQDPTGQIWTTYWESDFTQMSIADLHRDFYLMDYSYYHDGGTASRAFEPNNVAIDQKGLHLSVQTETVDKKVPSAGLYTRRSAEITLYAPHSQTLCVPKQPGLRLWCLPF